MSVHLIFICSTFAMTARRVRWALSATADPCYVCGVLY